MECQTPYDLATASCGREASEVRFMYFSPEEVKNLSVVQVEDLVTFDQWSVPVPGGLHSEEMGPLKGFDACSQVCQTCGLDKDCPGHMGHIEFAALLYNPFLITSLMKLLRQTCVVCNKFKCHEAVTAALVRTLQRLSPGDLAERLPPMQTKSAFLSELHPETDELAFRVEEITRGGVKVTRETMPPRTSKDLLQASEKLVSQLDAARQAKPEPKRVEAKQAGVQNSAALEQLRAVIASFVADLPSSCVRCKVQSKWRKEGYDTMFVKPEKNAQELLALPHYARDLLRSLWKNEAAILRFLVPAARDVGPDVFFLERLLVAPNRFRPPGQGEKRPQLFPHSQHLKHILEANREVMQSMSAEASEAPQKTVQQAVAQLQLAVNAFMDKMKSGRNVKLSSDGVRQLLEKKEGLFRMRMMGKRVNYAARSVISPDPNIEPSEIGVPVEIARTLSYPEVATQYNVKWLRSLVQRGALKYPGALEVHQPRPDGSKHIVKLNRQNQEGLDTIAKQLVTDIKMGKPPCTVFRQLQDGDPLLVNRQPTLHKPGIMAHAAKVLHREQTIRLHYVNCNTYNADFDGDEMNLHAPQDPISRMEALAIAKADFQYLVPTSGKPLRGLIQDHVIAGTMLTKRDSYYTKSEVCLLLYSGLRHALETSKQDQERASGAVKRCAQSSRVELDPPALLRPVAMWSGKQVLSMLLKHLIKICNPEDTDAGVNLDGKSKTPGDIWNGKLDGDKEEATILFRGTDLLQGVLDKASFGAETAGITHMCFELFGGRLASLWLSGISRLFTLLLQMRGFTCAYEDLILRAETDEVRAQLVSKARAAAVEVAKSWVHKHDPSASLPQKPSLEQLSEAAKGLLQQKQTVEHWEGLVIGKMKEFWSGMINKCIPVGQRLAVPRNCFASMVQTGAKGSKVNQSQVSCCLGQQELEGRLPPLMSTQRSLPCFAKNDLSNRTRGYIADRFLTGIRPQEFFFHCMAGREGLVDTAVKTSRSGYLQRCLVKHMESLKVSYDHTVRDSDGSILQFLYGEDGADVTRATYLYKFEELWSNFHFLDKPAQNRLKMAREMPRSLNMQCAPLYLDAKAAAKEGDVTRAIEAIDELRGLSEEMDSQAQSALSTLKKELSKLKKQRSTTRCDDLFDPCTSLFGPGHYFGSTSEIHEEALQAFVEKNLKNGRMSNKQAMRFQRAMRLKFQKTLAEPGEAVGVIAAQSMGEPSTQMTLNTFHLAGHGGANVTLGIPRLREIIQTASRSCSTPLMTVPIVSKDADGKPLPQQQQMASAQSLKRRFRKVTLMDCIARMVVNESVRLIAGEPVWIYHCQLEFLALEDLCKAVPYVTEERLSTYLSDHVCKQLKKELQRLIRESKDAKVKAGKKLAPTAEREGEEEGEDERPEKASKSKKKRKILGAEDKLEAEEEKEAEEEEAGEDGSENSGMYSTEEEAAAPDEAEPDEAELAGAENKDQPEVEEEEELPWEKAPTDSEDEKEEQEEKEEKEDEDMKEEDVKEEDKMDEGDTGGTKVEEEDSEDAGSGSLSKKKKKIGKAPKEVKKVKLEAAKGRYSQHEALTQATVDLHEALNSDKMLWASPLRGNKLTLIVTHRHKQCPHSLFVGEVLRRILEASELQDPACSGVKEVHVKVEQKEVSLQCEGINLFGLQALPATVVDHRKIYTNDIRKILAVYGVEAARASVVKEVRNVFGHYGIQVNHRHLALIADYMAQGGELRAFNRMGMQSCPSPLLQMSYETTMQFLSTACQEALWDNMRSPASSIVLGKPPEVGTGMVHLLVDLEPPEPVWKKRRKFKF